MSRAPERTPMHAATAESAAARELRDIRRASVVLAAQCARRSGLAAECAALLLAGPLGPKVQAA